MAQCNLFNNYYDYGELIYNVEDIEERLEDIAGSLANMLLINAAGGVKLWSIPHPDNPEEFEDCYWHNSGSPIIFKSTCVFFAVGDWSTIPTGAVTFEFSLSGTNYKAYISPDSMGEVELPIYTETGTTPAVTLKATEFKGIATFDISSIANSWYSEDYVYDNRPGVKAIDVAVVLRTKDLFEQGEYLKFLCVKGARSDNNEGFGSDDPTLLTHTRQFYVNPTGSNLPHPSNLVTVLFGDGATYTSGGVSHHYSRGEVWHFSAEMFSWLNSLMHVNLVQSPSSCPSRLFVRWINQDGGMESFMFIRKQIFERTAKTSNTKAQYNDYSKDNANHTIPFNLDHGKTISCGADHLTKSQFDIIQTIPVSSYIVTALEIRWNLSRLLRLSVKDFKQKYDTTTNTYSFEITFNLPDEVFEF